MNNEPLSPSTNDNEPDARFIYVVKQEYDEFMPKFINYMCKKFTFLTQAEAQDVYQDVFISIYDNISKGRVRLDTNWEAYMLRIGNNIVCRNHRSGQLEMRSIDDLFGDSDNDNTDRRLDNLMAQSQEAFQEEDSDPYSDPELLEILNRRIAEIPERCVQIMRLHYFDNMTMDNIATIMGYANAVTVRNRKTQCMKALAQKVKADARNAGFDL